MPSNNWILFVKSYASKHNLKYKDALKDPKCKAAYTPVVKGKGPTSSKIVPIAPISPIPTPEPEPENNFEDDYEEEFDLFEDNDPINSLSMEELKSILKELEKNRRRILYDLVHKKQSNSEELKQEFQLIENDIDKVMNRLRSFKGKGLRAIARKMHGKGPSTIKIPGPLVANPMKPTIEPHRPISISKSKLHINKKIKGGSLTKASLANKINSMLSSANRLREDINPIVEPYEEFDDDWGQLFHFVAAEGPMRLNELQTATQRDLIRINNELRDTVTAISRVFRAIYPDEPVTDVEGGKIYGKGPAAPEIADSSQRSSIIINLRNLLANISTNLLRWEEEGYRISTDDIVESDFRYTDMEILLENVNDIQEDRFLTQIRTVSNFINRMRQQYGRDVTDVMEGGKLNIPLNKVLYTDEMIRRRREGNVPNVILPNLPEGITQEQLLQQIRERQRLERERQRQERERERLRLERQRESQERGFMNIQDTNALQPITEESIQQRLQSLQDLFMSYGNRQTGGKITGKAVKDWVSPSAWSDYASSIVKGRNDYPPKMREIIAKYGDKPIMRMQACRTPLSSFMTTALNIASLGEFNKRFANMPHDKLFHLDLRVEIADDTGKSKKLTTILLEKTEVLNALVSPTKKSDTECSLIQFQKPLTINKMLEGAKKIQGDKFFKYSANNNNCQDFIMALLKGVGAGTQQNYEFIKQDTKELFKGLPFFRKLTNTVTDIGAAANTILEGSGKMIKGKGVSVRDALIYLITGMMGFSSVAALLIHINDRLNRARRQVAPEVVAVLENVAEDIENRLNAGQPISEILAEAHLVDENESPMTYSRSTSINTIPEEDVKEIPSATAVRAPTSTGGKIQKSSNYYVQTIIFDKSKFDKKSASDWIKKHEYENKGIDEKEDTLHFRQVNPDYIKKKNFNKFRTKKIGKNSGISFVLAYK